MTELQFKEAEKLIDQIKSIENSIGWWKDAATMRIRLTVKNGNYHDADSGFVDFETIRQYAIAKATAKLLQVKIQLDSI